MATSDRVERLYLLDGANLLFRGFFAIRSLTNSQGFPTNALFGFANMFTKLLREEAPDLCAVVYDAPGATHRDEIYPDYKGNRPSMPDDLRVQVPYFSKLVAGFRVPFLEVPGVEADDVIATLALRAAAAGRHVTIVSSDKDLAQLVRPGIELLDTMAGKRFTEADVLEKWGVRADQIGDYLSLLGDAVDNIPGVPGVGAKTAAQLLQEFGTLDAIYANLSTIGASRAAKLEAGRESAMMSRKLVALRIDCDVGISWDELRVGEPDRETLGALFGELEFKGLKREFGPRSEPVSAAAAEVAHTPAQLEVLLAQVRASTRVYARAWPTQSNLSGTSWVGFGVATHEGPAWYVPLERASNDLFAPRTPPAPVTEVLRAAAGKLVAFDANTLHHFAQTLGLPEVAIERDLQLLSYAIDPGKYKHTLANVAIDLLSLNAAPPKALGDGDGAYSAAAALPDACALMATELSAMRQLEPVLVKAAQEARVWELVQTLELPLTGVLAAMERRGVAIDTRALGDMSEKIEASLSALEREIFAAAGGEFAIGSPKQLAEILFGKLGLAAGKRTKSGPSTDSSVLEALRDEHPIVGAVLEWRGLSKLRGTYVDALPKLVHPVSGRIHTHFSQVTAATGRLSSSEPNLQAIPVRGPLGRAMRAAFVAAPGMSLVSADYSQIELRLLAHLAHSASLIKAFQAGVDVHKATAAEIFGVPLDQVSPEMRRRAKTVNFGVLYGMGPVRLARDLSISRGEASAFIERYFERFPEIRAYMDRCTEEARSTGEVRTLLGRRRRLADITSSNRQAAAAAERMATNTPVQGSAADIVKVAMLRVHSALQERFPAAGLVAQVHDELLVECLAEQAEAVSALMRDLMEHVVTLEVPLEVNCGSGANWDEAH